MRLTLLIVLISLIVISYRFTLVQDQLAYIEAWNRVKRIRVDLLEKRIQQLETIIDALQ